MARKEDAQDDLQRVPDEVEEILAKIFAQQAEEKARMEREYQAMREQTRRRMEEEAQRPAPLRLVPKKREPRPKYNPDEEEAYLLELVRMFPDMEMESFVEEFRHRRRLFEQLVAAREEAGLTQAEVAKRMSVPRAEVERLEIGDGDPRFSRLERYAKALGKKLEWRLS